MRFQRRIWIPSLLAAGAIFATAIGVMASAKPAVKAAAPAIIHACTNIHTHVVSLASPGCAKGESGLFWNRQGQKGDTGPRGPKGATGARGPRGYMGIAGPAGAVGPAGAAGQIGLTGPAGPTGPQGPMGPGGTGPMGPMGPAGPAGAAGATGSAGTNGSNGANGTNGTDGLSVLSGFGMPSASQAGAVAGDFYIDTATSALYGPATGSAGSLAWGAGVSLKGPQGTAGSNGTNGATWFTGSGDPNTTPPSGAVTGDMYVDTATGNYYTLASGGSWTLDGDLTGAAGTNGTAVLNGTVDPNTTPPSGAVDGDFYIDTATSTLYGPATGSAPFAWGSGTSLVGPASDIETSFPAASVPVTTTAAPAASTSLTDTAGGGGIVANATAVATASAADTLTCSVLINTVAVGNGITLAMPSGEAVPIAVTAATQIGSHGPGSETVALQCSTTTGSDITLTDVNLTASVLH